MKIRKNFDKSKKIFLLDWFNKNILHPYPDKDKIEYFSVMTGLTPKQVNTFFINERKRNQTYNLYYKIK